MGWTGTFYWSSKEKNRDILKKELFGDPNWKFEDVAWSGEGGHTWCLFRNKETGKHYATCILCQRDRKNNEFLYKYINLIDGPNEVDMPASWLSMIDREYLENDCSSWLERYNAAQEKKRNGPRFNVGDVYKLTCPYEIGWPGKSIPSGTGFYVLVDNDNGCSRKYYQLLELRDNSEYENYSNELFLKTGLPLKKTMENGRFLTLNSFVFKNCSSFEVIHDNKPRIKSMEKKQDNPEFDFGFSGR